MVSEGNFFLQKTQKIIVFGVHIPFPWTLWTLVNPAKIGKIDSPNRGFARILHEPSWTLSSLGRFSKNAKSHEANLPRMMRKAIHVSKRESHKISKMKCRGSIASKPVERRVRVCKHKSLATHSRDIKSIYEADPHRECFMKNVFICFSWPFGSSPVTLRAPSRNLSWVSHEPSCTLHESSAVVTPRLSGSTEKNYY